MLTAAAAGSTTGLTLSRVETLWVLHNAGPLPQRALVEALGTTPRSVSSLIDGLERAGYAARHPHPKDRRAVLVTLTDQGARLTTRIADDHAALSSALLDAVDPADRAAFERGIDAVFRRLDQLVRGGESRGSGLFQLEGKFSAPSAGKHRDPGSGSAR